MFPPTAILGDDAQATRRCPRSATSARIPAERRTANVEA